MCSCLRMNIANETTRAVNVVNSYGSLIFRNFFFPLEFFFFIKCGKINISTGKTLISWEKDHISETIERSKFRILNSIVTLIIFFFHIFSTFVVVTRFFFLFFVGLCKLDYDVCKLSNANTRSKCVDTWIVEVRSLLIWKKLFTVQTF